MTKLSVNINKVALLRNTRHLDLPSVVWSARVALDAGAAGVTVHPRPDQRHIRATDVPAIAELLLEPAYAEREFNIEGNPFEGRFMEHVRDVRPDQCTLVPDDPGAFTSDAGWDVRKHMEKLKQIVGELKAFGGRVSLFMDADVQQVQLAAETGADRVELYTEPYAAAYGTADQDRVTADFAAAAEAAGEAGLQVNAGHDLSLVNLEHFLANVPNVLEVSIGHALIADALEMGLAEAVRAYLGITSAG